MLLNLFFNFMELLTEFTDETNSADTFILHDRSQLFLFFLLILLNKH